MGSGDNNPLLKLSTTNFQSQCLGLIPAGTTTTQSFPLVLDNDTLSSGPLYVKPITQPDWGVVTVTFSQLDPSPTAPAAPLSGLGNGYATTTPVAWTGTPLTDAGLSSTTPVACPSPSLQTATFGQSVSSLTSGSGVLWPAGPVYTTAPGQGPNPATNIPIPGSPPGYTGVSKAPAYSGMTCSVSSLPYPRTAPANLLGTSMAGVLDLDTWTGRQYHLSVSVQVNPAGYSRITPTNNVKSFKLQVANGSGTVVATLAFGLTICDPLGKNIGGPLAGVPAYVQALVPNG